MALTQKSKERTRAWPRTAALLALLATLLLLPLALAPRAEAFIYWTDSSQDSIGRANLDGTGINPSFITAPQPYGLTVNAAHIYWPAFYGGIASANLDGTGVDQSFISTSPLPAWQVAADADHIHWGSPFTGTIARANLDGTGVDQSFISVHGSAGDIATDAEHVYWSEAVCEYPGPSCTRAIARADLDGTNVDHSFISDHASYIAGIAVDEGHIYWGAPDSFYGPSAIARANLDGTNIDRTFITGENQIHDVAVDADHVYWSHEVTSDGGSHGPITSDQRIGRANLDGTGVDQAFVDFPRGVTANDLAIDALTDTKVAGKASAAKTQRQSARRIVVRVKVKAKERLTAKATGKIKVNSTYKLSPKEIELARGKARTLKLKPKKAKAKKVARALKQGEKAIAKLTVRLTDLAGNGETEKLRVRLKGEQP